MHPKGSSVLETAGGHGRYRQEWFGYLVPNSLLLAGHMQLAVEMVLGGFGWTSHFKTTCHELDFTFLCFAGVITTPNTQISSTSYPPAMAL